MTDNFDKVKINSGESEVFDPESSERPAPESSDQKVTTGRCIPTGRLSNELIRGFNNADSISNDTFIQRISEARGANTKQYTVTRERQEITINTPHGVIKYKNGFIDKLAGKHSDNTIIPLAEMLLTRLFDTLIREPKNNYFTITTDELIASGLYKSANSVRAHFENDYCTYLRGNVVLNFDRFIGKKKTRVIGVDVFPPIEHEVGTKKYRVKYDIDYVNDLRYIFCGEFVPLGDVWDKLHGDGRRLYLYMLIQTRINATKITTGDSYDTAPIKRSKTTAAVFCGFPLDFELKGNPNKNKHAKRLDNALNELKALQDTGELEFIITDNNDSFSFAVTDQTQSGAQLHNALYSIADGKAESIEEKRKSSDE